jgi:hypothetical protein
MVAESSQKTRDHDAHQFVVSDLSTYPPLFLKSNSTNTNNEPSDHQNQRYATAKLAAKSHDLAAYYVRGEGAVTNFGVAAARDAWRECPQTYSPVLQRSLQAAIARLQAIGAAGGAKAGTQQCHPNARAGFAGGPIGPIDAQAVATRMVAATMAGAGPSPGLMRELFQAVSFGHPSKAPGVHDFNKRGVLIKTGYYAKVRRVTAMTLVLVLAAMRAPAASWA